MQVTAIGRTKILFDAIESVREAGHDVSRIVTSESEDFYRTSAADFEDLASAIGADFFLSPDVNDPGFVSEVAGDDVAISVNWNHLLERPVLDAFEHGVLNAHAGDLPRFRGNAAPNWALIAGEEEVVLTVHRMAPELDAGPIFRQRCVPIDEDTRLLEIYEAMWTGFPEMFVEVIEGLERGTIEPEPQPDDPTRALRGYPRIPEDSELDWDRPAADLDRLVRASSEPLFGAYTYIGTEKLTVWRAHIEHPPHEYLGTPGQVAERRPESGEVAVIAGDGFLILEEVETEEGDRAPAADVITSVRTRLGMDVQGEIRELSSRLSELEAELHGPTGEQ